MLLLYADDSTFNYGSIIPRFTSVVLQSQLDILPEYLLLLNSGGDTEPPPNLAAPSGIFSLQRIHVQGRS